MFVKDRFVKSNKLEVLLETFNPEYFYAEIDHVHIERTLTGKFYVNFYFNDHCKYSVYLTQSNFNDLMRALKVAIERHYSQVEFEDEDEYELRLVGSHLDYILQACEAIQAQKEAA